jgi:hypothetical protein
LPAKPREKPCTDDFASQLLPFKKVENYEYYIFIVRRRKI